MTLDRFLGKLPLSEEQREEERNLREQLQQRWKKHTHGRLHLGQLLATLRDEYVGRKQFKRYLVLNRIPRTRAYRLLAEWEGVRQLKMPETVLEQAAERDLNLASEDCQEALRRLPMPKNPTAEDAKQYLDKVESEATRARSERKARQRPTTPEGRRAVFFQRALKGLRKIDRDITRLYEDLPPEERRVELLTELFSHLAGALGVEQTLTIEPCRPPLELHLPVEKYEARLEKQRQTQVQGETA